MRVRDWDRRLADWATARFGAPFAWGRTDCALLCLEAVDALTGGDLAGRYRGAWRTRREAILFARHNDLIAGVAAAGCRRVDVGFQQRGDLLLRPGRVFVEGHVCLGQTVLSSWVSLGVATAPTRDVLALPGVVVLRAE